MTGPLLPLLARGPKFARGWPLHPQGAAITYHPLSWLLTTAHAGDAHVSAYSVPSVPRRLTTSGTPAYTQVPGGVPMAAFLWDLDCAQSHRAMGGTGAVHADDGWWADTHRRIRVLFAVHPGGFAYRTRGGARLVYTLPEPYIITDAAGELGWKRRYLSSLAYLARRFDLVCDPSISDWPRAIRLPYCTRDGVPQRLEVLGNPHAVGSFTYAPTEADDALDLETVRSLATHATPWAPVLRILARNALPPSRTPRAPRVVEHRPAVDVGTLGPLAADLGTALRSLHGRHGVHLALAGACYARGVPLDQGPELARAICYSSGESDDRPQVWQTTADRIRGGQAVSGYGFLAQHHPSLAAVVDAALPADGGARAARDELDARGTHATIAPADAAAAIRAVLDNPSAGLQVVRVTEGAGKTRATGDALIAACEAGAAYERVPGARKILYAAATHAVAIAVAERLQGLRAHYRRGVLGVKDAAGAPACPYHVPLGRLLAGGHAAATWCDGPGMGRQGADAPCALRDTCPAYQGQVVDLGCGPDQTPVVMVTVHALLSEGLAWAGDSALVVIDENPQAVETVTLPRADLEAAAGAVELFAPSESWRSPVLRALAAGLERGELVTGDALREVWARGCAALAGEPAWVDAMATALEPGTPAEWLERAAVQSVWTWVQRDPAEPGAWHRRRAWAPRPSRRERARVFAGTATENFITSSQTHARVARLLAGVIRATAPLAAPHAERAVSAVEVAYQDATRRVLRGVVAHPALAAALRRSGPTVLLDATADLSVLGALAGGEVPVTDIRVADGAPVLRRLLYWSGASRKTLLEGDRIRWDLGLARYAGEAIRQAVAFTPRPTVAIFAWKAVADRIRRALAGDTTDPVATDLVEQVRATGGTLVVGHYGAARGRDDWMEADVLVSLCDPMPNVGDLRAIAAVLGLSADASAVYQRAAAAEISQVGGRLRAPWRTKPALHLHVGRLAPLAWDTTAEVLELPKGAGESLDARTAAAAVRVYGSQRLAGGILGVRREAVGAVLKTRVLSGGHTMSGVTLSKTVEEAYRAECDSAESHGKAPVTPRFEVPHPWRDSPQVAVIHAAGGAQAVAKLLGIGKATVYHWQSGARPMPDDAIAAVRAHLAETSASTGTATATDRGESPSVDRTPSHGRFTAPRVSW